MKRFLRLFIPFLLFLCAARAFAESERIPSAVSSVRLESHVENDGQRLDFVRAEVPLPLPVGLGAEDFEFTCEIRWSDRTFKAKPEGLVREEKGFSLSCGRMQETWDNVTWWRVTCSDPRFSFDKGKLAGARTAVADDFAPVRMYRSDWSPTGRDFDFDLFSPEDASAPRPLVLVLHGSGDFNVLVSGRQALCWAEPEFQAENPCYVLVPYFEEATLLTDDEVLRAVVEEIRSMIEDGLVDPARVYVTGLSLGGFNGFRLLTRYSEAPLFAAAVLYCPWLDPELTEEEISRAAGTPMWVVYGEHDTDVPDPGAIARRLRALGGTACRERVYTDEEYAEAGVRSRHAVDLLALRDGFFRDWMMAQRLPSPD